MREILFRGKSDLLGWIEGWYCPEVNWGGHHFPVGITRKTKDGWLDDVAVIPETIGQFTGLTDTNGKKVFEGDILKFTDTNANYEWIGIVEFGNPNAEYNWGFQLVYISGTKANIDILMWFDMEESGAFCEVIGNIHDNPELLGDDRE